MVRPNEVSDISLGTLDDVIDTIVPIATSLERLHLAVSGPDLRDLARMSLQTQPRWLGDLRDVRRAVNGLGRLLQLVGVLEARVLHYIPRAVR